MLDKKMAHHEVTLDKVELMSQALLLSIMCGSVDLVVIVVKTSDVGAGELGNLAGRSTDTAANIKDLHSLLDSNAMSKIVFVASDSLTERLAMGEAAEVERLAPSVLVQISGKIVIAEANTLDR